MRLSSVTRLKHSTVSPLSAVKSLPGTADSVEIEEFRQKAFYSERPLLLSSRGTTSNSSTHLASLPAAQKWFNKAGSSLNKSSVLLSSEYLNSYAATILPYEMAGPLNVPLVDLLKHGRSIQKLEGNSDQFHHFYAPLSLILSNRSEGLYIAQAPITDLPPQLQHDLPAPKLVFEAGNGDIYNANIWIGNPPTYTPLHKDPNPNFFIQLAGRKKLRLCEPQIGIEIFQQVQRRLGRVEGDGRFRGKEMMEGTERKELEEAVWGMDAESKWNIMEVFVEPGDSLFIPKGWWHSVKGLKIGAQEGINASVNWWFR
ncbi:Lysine-specific demethylase JMJ30 [Golovinomyces cichoracearum]|uniref:Lysine-specific demethylase JMJ30 n=1 Tax=Golovinomyces cichoracearum TaxID=62708 RepID=A0A420IZH0_9PEZI|nr:Lysine-specific demethylase JMJ30 [Golovinomyces cichoracearum]